LLVLALLAGLMGMHALAPGAAVADDHPHGVPMAVAGSGSASAPASASAHTPASGAAPVSGTASPYAPFTLAATASVSAPASVSAAHEGCGDAGGCGSGHVTHADTTCSAAAVSGGPSLPALVPDPVAGVVPDESVRAHAGADPEGARAPPSLAELQLLRI
jgi:hypothetical protein